MSAEPDWVLVDRYLSGECTPEERQAIDAWIAADPSHAQLIASMRRVWTEAATPLPYIDEKAAWLALQTRRNVAQRPARAGLTMPPSLRKASAPRFGWRARAIAAGLVAATALGAAGWWKHAQELQVAVAVPPREYVTERGQRAEVTLIDGTRVWLSADSHLRGAAELRCDDARRDARTAKRISWCSTMPSAHSACTRVRACRKISERSSMCERIRATPVRS